MNRLAQPGRKLTRQQLVLSVFLTLVSAVLTYFIWGLGHAYSALAGGSIGIIPNFVFALYAFRHAGARASELVMNSFFKGVKIKMVLTAILFALCFKFITLSLLPFFMTYILAVASPIVFAAATKFTFNQQ
ncbi:ATP synthase subunit I [Thalassotalea atypica]|uniref:ATP synthase subunit I n=1 Tax=Thalassotalea atypica TaxID=2054316 RepID=UPI002572965B|nr:ATP synthase subunit I [Thalassotalea atypica]